MAPLATLLLPGRGAGVRLVKRSLGWGLACQVNRFSHRARLMVCASLRRRTVKHGKCERRGEVR